MILGYCGAHRFYTCLPVPIAGLREPGRTRHPDWFFFRAMKITAWQSVCRLHSCGGTLSWCLYLVLIVGGSLLCLAHLFDILLNLPKTDGALCSSTLANWLMPFCNLSSFYVVKLQSFSVFLLLGWCCLGRLYPHQKGAVLLVIVAMFTSSHQCMCSLCWSNHYNYTSSMSCVLLCHQAYLLNITVFFLSECSQMGKVRCVGKPPSIKLTWDQCIVNRDGGGPYSSCSNRMVQKLT